MTNASPRPPRAPTDSARLLQLSIELLREAGIDVNELLRRTALEFVTALEPERRLPVAHMNRLSAEALRMSGDDLLGLRTGALLHPERFDVAGYTAKLSPTLAHVITRVSRYARLVSDRYVVTLEVEGDRATFALTPAEGAGDQTHISEGALAALGLMAREVTGRQLEPIEVRFVHAERPRSERLAALFGAPARLGAPHNALVFDAAYLELPILGYDPTLSEILERNAERMLAEMPEASEFVAAVREAIGNALPDGDVSAREIARALGTSARSLRRNLRDQGVSYQALLDGVRYELAKRHLRSGRMNASEVAFSVGFADVSSFTRAFKRWSGTTPTAYSRGRD